MSTNVSSTGTVTTTNYGVTVDSEGNVDLSGLVDKTMQALDIHAPKFVSQMVGIALETEASTLAIEGAVSAAAAALPAEVGGAVAALGAFAPVAAIVLAVPALLYLIVGAAEGGTGCCGTAPYTREQAIKALQLMKDPFHPDTSYQPSETDIRNLMMYSGQDADAPPCDPSQYAWPVYTESTSPGEQFVNATIKAAYKQGTGCWSNMTAADYMVALATGVGIWNRTHSSQRTIDVNGRTTTLGPTFVSRMVNVTQTLPWQDSTYQVTGQAEGTDPISVALNESAMKIDSKGQGDGFIVPPNALASFHLNEGPALTQAQMARQNLIDSVSQAAHIIPTSWITSFKPSTPAPVVQVRASGPVSTAVAPVVTSAWDKQRVWLGGATPKQAGIFAGVATAGTWLLRVALRRVV